MWSFLRLSRITSITFTASTPVCLAGRRYSRAFQQVSTSPRCARRLSAFQLLVPVRHFERRARLPLAAVPQANQGETRTAEADMLTSEGRRSERADKAAQPPC